MLNGSIDLDMIEALASKLEALGGVQAILEGSVRLVGVEAQPNIVHVNREEDLHFPANMVQLMHPELRYTGPTEYDLTQLEQWRHPDQDNDDYDKRPDLRAVYDYLKDNALLERCLSLADGNEIGWRREGHLCDYLGVAEDDSIHGYLWRSVFRDDDKLYVPYLVCSNSVFTRGRIIGISWARIEDSSRALRKRVALMFPPNT